MKPPKQITVNMQQKDVARNLVDIVNTMEAVRIESLRNFHASDGVKLDYLRLASELASCIQDVIKENNLEDYVRKVTSFIDDDGLLYYFDPSQKGFWNDIEPAFTEALFDFSVVVMRDDFVSEGCAHHIFQGLKYLIAPSEIKEEVYTSIQPFNNLLSEDLISRPEVAQYVVKKLFLDYVEQSSDGYGMALLNTNLNTPEFVERLSQIGALFVDVPYKHFSQMRKAFSRSTVIGEGKDKKARIIFAPETDEAAQNMFKFFSKYAEMDLGDVEECLSQNVKNIYGFGKKFLKAMQEEIGILESYEKREKVRKVLSDPSKIIKEGDVYVISNITLYDLDGLPYVQYPEIRLDASPVREGGEVVSESQRGWLDFYARGDKSLPSLPLLYAVMEVAYDNKDKGVAQELLQSLQSDFDPSYLVTSTRFNYDQNKVWHDVSTPEQVEFDIHIPGISDYLENIVKLSEWERPLRSIFMINDIEKLPEVLSVYNNRKGYLYIPEDNRGVERAAFVGFGDGGFDVCGDLYIDGRSRGVSAEGATRAK